MKKKHSRENLRIAMLGQKRIPSREGGIEIVVEELATRMAKKSHSVTCYNRKGHNVADNRQHQEAGMRKTLRKLERGCGNKLRDDCHNHVENTLAMH